MPNKALDYESPIAPATPILPEHLLENLGNQELSIWQKETEIIDGIQNNQVTLIFSPTGTGKSTQIAPLAWKAGFNRLMHTQPRRRAAMNVADRVEYELEEAIGEEQALGMVACHTGAGLDGEYLASLTVGTEATLRMRDTHDRSPKRNDIKELLVLDEVHEAGVEMWRLRGLVKMKLETDPDFRVVVMTATPDKWSEIDFFTKDDGTEPAIVELESGTNYEIEHIEEPLSNTAREAIKAAIDIHENPDDFDGANTIQVFEAGKREIKETINEILRSLPPQVRAKTMVLPNHAKLTPEAQQPCYDDYDGIKIVVQTNIGKTSMTIPRTRTVITSGKERQIVLDPEDGTPGLEKVDITIDDIFQQKGRAGRTSAGRFVHTRHDGDDFVPLSERAEHPEPEILRSNIDSVVMGLIADGFDVRAYPSKPKIPEASLVRSIHRLQIMGVLNDREEITNLGERMTKYPASPEHQRCLAEVENAPVQIRMAMAAMVAAAEVGGLRLFEPGSTSWETYTEETSSDLFAQLDTFIKIKRKHVNEAGKEDLDLNNVRRADELYRKMVHRSGIEDIPELRVPGPKERHLLKEAIIRSFAHSAYLPAGDGLFKALGGATRLREVSNRSVVSKFTRNAVVGRAFDIQIERDGVAERKPIIELVTEVPIRELGKYATNLTHWRNTGYQLRGGKFVQVQEQILGRQVLSTREVVAQPSPQLRAAVIEQVKVQPGPSLKMLYGIKSDLERLARRSRTPIMLMTQDKIDAMIASAAPDDTKSPGAIDENLRQMIEDADIRLDRFVSKERQEQILKDAPDSIELNGYTLKVNYVGGKPIARRTHEDVILGLKTEPTLPDGRQILFMYEDKRHTWHQVRQRIIGAGEI